jgi:hypothetical protein
LCSQVSRAEGASYSAFFPFPFGFGSEAAAGFESILAGFVSEDFESVADELLSDFVSELVDLESAAADFL